jgi:hypothetical protein
MRHAGALHEALQDEPGTTRLKADEILRSLIKEIILTPEAGVLNRRPRRSRAHSASVQHDRSHAKRPGHWRWAFCVSWSVCGCGDLNRPTMFSDRQLEHVLGKDGVGSSILLGSTIIILKIRNNMR